MFHGIHLFGIETFASSKDYYRTITINGYGENMVIEEKRKSEGYT